MNINYFEDNNECAIEGCDCEENEIIHNLT